MDSGTITTIITVVYIAIIAVVLLVAFIKGWKKGLLGALMKFGATVLAVLFAVITTKLVSPTLFDFECSIIENNTDIGISSFTAEEINLLKPLFASITGIILFIPLFYVWRFVLMIPELILGKIFGKGLEFPFSKPIAGFVSAITSCLGLIISFSLALYLLPLSNGVLGSIQESEENENKSISVVKNEYIAPLADTFVIKASETIVSPIYDTVAGIEYETAQTDLESEIATIVSAVKDVADIAENDNRSISGIIRKLSARIADDRYMCEVGETIVKRLVDVSKNGGKFFGCTIDIENEYIKAMIGGFEKTTHETLCDDLNTVADIIYELEKSDALGELKDGGDIMSVIRQEETVASVFKLAYSNERIRASVVAAYNTAVKDASEQFGISENNCYIDAEKLPDLTSDELEKESAVFANAVKQLTDFVDDAESEDVNLSELGKTLDTMKDSRIFSEQVDALAEAVVSSDKLIDEGIVTRESVERMKKANDGKDYENKFASLDNALGLIDAVTADKDGADYIAWLSSEMTKESAPFVAASVDKKYFTDCGLADLPAEKLADLVALYINKLGESPTLNESEAQAEYDCIKYVYEIGNSVNRGFVFGDIIPSAEKLVKVYAESPIIADCVTEFAEQSKEKDDLIGVSEYINAEEKTQIKNVLNKYIEDNYSSSNNKAQFKSRIESLAYIFELNSEIEW